MHVNAWINKHRSRSEMRSDYPAALTVIGDNCSKSDGLFFALVLVMCGRLHRTFISDVNASSFIVFFFIV